MNKEMIFADNLKKAIENAGINMTVLANETGITLQYDKKILPRAGGAYGVIRSENGKGAECVAG